MEREKEVLQNGARAPMIHDLDASKMGEWEGPKIPREEFKEVKKTRLKKTKGYDLWADLGSLKADITF